MEIDCENAIVVEGNHSYKEAKELCSQGQGVILQGDLYIVDLQTVENLQGLECICGLGEDLLIWGNAGLLDLSGLEPLTSIGGHLVIGSSEFYGDPKLEIIDKTCGSFYTKNQLTSLGGLDNLESVGGFVVVRCNPKLIALGPIPKLKSVGNKLPELLTPEQAAKFPYAMVVIRNQLLESVKAVSIDKVENGTFGIACNAAGFTKEVAQEAVLKATVEAIPNLTCF